MTRRLFSVRRVALAGALVWIGCANDTPVDEPEGVDAAGETRGVDAAKPREPDAAIASEPEPSVKRDAESRAEDTRDAGGAADTSAPDTGADGASVADTAPGVRPLGCVLPLGDSITQAAAGHLGYRYWLWSSLKAQFPPLRFVGSQTATNGGATTYPDAQFDRRHEGHWGWRADQLLASLPGWLGGYTPGIALLHVGSNDAFQGNSVDSTVGELGKIIDLLRGKNPRVVVLLAKLIPTTSGGNAAVNALNAKLPGLVAQKTTAASPVSLVDQNAGFDAGKETYDGVHPNEAGEKKMAARWVAALMPMLAAGVDICPK